VRNRLEGNQLGGLVVHLRSLVRRMEQLTTRRRGCGRLLYWHRRVRCRELGGGNQGSWLQVRNR